MEVVLEADALVYHGRTEAQERGVSEMAHLTTYTQVTEEPGTNLNQLTVECTLLHIFKSSPYDVFFFYLN